MIQKDYITREYLDETLNKKLENYPTKDYLDDRFKAQSKEMKQFMTDLKTGFKEEVKVVCDQVKAIDDKIVILQQDVTLIKDVLTEKTDRNETLKLEKRVLRLEQAKIAKT